MEQKSFSIKGNIVDVVHKQIYAGEVKVVNGKIASVTPLPKVETDQFILLVL